MIDTLTNCFDEIKFSFENVEKQIEAYHLTFDRTRNERVEWRLKLPMFVLSFYGYIKSRNLIPSQNDFWQFYVSENKKYLTSLKLSKEEKTGVRARIFRTYPSLVRDLHFGLYIKERKNFRSVFYNEWIDIAYGIDLIVEIREGKKIGLKLFTQTRAGSEAREIKDHRLKKSAELDCYELPIEFRGSRMCGEFFLYSEREIDRVVEKIEKFNKGDILQQG